MGAAGNCQARPDPAPAAILPLPRPAHRRRSLSAGGAAMARGWPARGGSSSGSRGGGHAIEAGGVGASRHRLCRSPTKGTGPGGIVKLGHLLGRAPARRLSRTLAPGAQARCGSARVCGAEAESVYYCRARATCRPPRVLAHGCFRRWNGRRGTVKRCSQRGKTRIKRDAPHTLRVGLGASGALSRSKASPTQPPNVSPSPVSPANPRCRTTPTTDSRTGACTAPASSRFASRRGCAAAAQPRRAEPQTAGGSGLWSVPNGRANPSTQRHWAAAASASA